MKNTFGIDKSWIEAGLDINLINQIMSIIEQKRQDREILPSQDDILNAIKLTSLDNAKVLIIGQDPYPSSEHAHGLRVKTYDYSNAQSTEYTLSLLF